MGFEFFPAFVEFGAALFAGVGDSGDGAFGLVDEEEVLGGEFVGVVFDVVVGFGFALDHLFVPLFEALGEGLAGFVQLFVGVVFWQGF